MEIVSTTTAYLVEYIFIPEVNQPPKRITSDGNGVFTLDESVSWNWQVGLRSVYGLQLH